jgi:hypothetical protein
MRTILYPTYQLLRAKCRAVYAGTIFNNTRLYIRLAIRIMINNVHLRIQLYYIIEKNTMKLLYA